MGDQSNPTGFNLEQYQLALRLENIFMPHFKRQRLQAGFGDDATDQPIRFVHYTSAEAALSIIKSKRLWMRNTTCMSDYREVQHGLDVLRGFFSDKEKAASFGSALEKCHEGVAHDAVGLFDQRLRDIQFSTYITSISEHDDTEDQNGRLSMWRGFGGNAARVALVFRIPKFSAGSLALNILFSPVAYLKEKEAHDVMGEVAKNIAENCDFLRSIDRQVILHTVFFTLLGAAVCLKHDGFREEREWRAIYSPTLRPSELMGSSTEVVGGVPQIVHKLPLDKTVTPALADLDVAHIFDRLIIGPSPYPWAMYEAFVEALLKAGVSEAAERVSASNIPIRA